MKTKKHFFHDQSESFCHFVKLYAELEEKIKRILNEYQAQGVTSGTIMTFLNDLIINIKIDMFMKTRFKVISTEKLKNMEGKQ